MNDPVPNFEFLDPNVKDVVELREKLKEAQEKPNTYDSNIEKQILRKAIETTLSLPETKLRIVK